MTRPNKGCEGRQTNKQTNKLDTEESDVNTGHVTKLKVMFDEEERVDYGSN